tara:strand:+ start:329 stop:571 length:243 start_codon:yes stop_codon:yes gene_type:complete
MEETKKGRPAGTGGIYKQRGSYATRQKGQESIQEKHMSYMRGLSTVVGEACDRYFERKGMKKALSWSAQAKEEKEKRKQK